MESMVKPKWVKMYLDIAERLAEESHAVRLKVGAVFVSPEGIMSTGINGMPAGGTNICELIVVNSYSIISGTGRGPVPSYETRTKPEVSHAEENLFGKLMRQGVSTKGGSIFLTHEPCIHCSKIILNAGVSEVWYREPYLGSNPSGKSWLIENSVICKSENYMNEPNANI